MHDAVHIYVGLEDGGHVLMETERKWRKFSSGRNPPAEFTGFDFNEEVPRDGDSHHDSG